MGDNIYITLSGQHTVRRLEFASDIVSIVAGTGTFGAGTEGPATASKLNQPWGIWGDSMDTYYIADKVNAVVRAVTNGIIKTVAGGTKAATSDGDGLAATSAVVASPNGVWISLNNVLYIADHSYGIRTVNMSVNSNRLIYRITGTEDLHCYQVWGNTVNQLFVGINVNEIIRSIQLDGTLTPGMSTFAGTGAYGPSLTPGPATSTNLNNPVGITADTDGASYVTEYHYHTVRMVDITGYMTVVVGTGIRSSNATETNGDGGPPTSATLYNPCYLFCDTNGFIYIADSGNHKIRKLYDPQPTSLPTSQPTQPTSQPSDETVEQPPGKPTVRPSSTPTHSHSSPPSNRPSVVPTLNIDSPETRSILSQITTVAGNGLAGYQPEGGAATSTPLSNPIGVWGDQMGGSIYITQRGQHTVRKVDFASNLMTTVVGTGELGASSDGPATSVTLHTPYGIWGDSMDTYYIADRYNDVVRSVSGGVVSTVAGSIKGTASDGDGGPATSAKVANPLGVWITPDNVLYISDYTYGIRTVNMSVASHRLINQIVGTSGMYGFQVWGNSLSQLFVGTDQFSNIVHRIEMTVSPPNIVAFAGTGIQSLNLGSGKATSISLGQPAGVAADVNGLSYVSEGDFSTVRLLDRNGFLTVLVGTGAASANPIATNGDGGPPTSATLRIPHYLFCNANSFVYIADRYNHKIRILYNLSPAPTSQPSIQPTSQPSSAPSSHQPRGEPTTERTNQPSRQPSTQPSGFPSVQPSSNPSSQPSSQPSGVPSMQPSSNPSSQPSSQPSGVPSVQPSSNPSNQPSSQPSCIPSVQPSSSPSSQPSSQPSDIPSAQPSNIPSRRPSSQLSSSPSSTPSMQPSGSPSRIPSMQPSSSPSRIPSMQPSGSPSSTPSMPPSSSPSRIPSMQPSSSPSRIPSMQPSSRPSRIPSIQPSSSPTSQPFSQPSSTPSIQPSSSPSIQPSSQSSDIPSVQRSSSPSSQPSIQPSSVPAVQPSSSPSSQPTEQPVARPSLVPLRANTPTRYPVTQQPTCFDLGTVSVQYQGVSDATQFKMVLPYLFTSYVSGDGLSDITVNSAQNATGYVLLGATRNVNKAISVSELRLSGPALSFDFSGRSVAIAGDINGDGHIDLIVGVPFAARVYVLFGTGDGFVGMTEGFTVFGAKSSDLTGWSVSGAGDVNNDGFADIIIGAPAARNVGAAFVLFGGSASGERDFYLSDMHSGGSEGTVIHGTASQDAFGLSVAAAGDANGDGYDDVIIGALMQGSFSAGATYVLFGNETQSSSVHVHDLNPSQGRVHYGASWSWLGYSVSGAGDVNGDNYTDIIIGSAPRRKVAGVPVSYLLFGNATLPQSGLITKAVEPYGVEITGGGVVVASLGDVNGDHYDDVLVVGDVDLSTGGGMLVQLSVALLPETMSPTPTPTYHPSLLPTLFPSTQPSQKPSTTPTAVPTQIPTRPTAVPTTAPSGPTRKPTMTPTHPTLLPSATPTAPSLKPTTQPTMAPSVTPSTLPTASPTEYPSSHPTVRPSTVATEQTYTPTTLSPSRYPVCRPSLRPSIFVARTVTYRQVVISLNDTYFRNTTYTQFIVNATGVVYISGSGGHCMFTILPQPQSVTRIEAFNTSSDTLDLRAFKHIHSVTELSFVESVSNANFRRLRTRMAQELSTTTVTILLQHNQRIELRGLTLSDFRIAQVSYSPPQPVHKSKSNIVPMAVGVALIVAVVIYSMYKLWKMFMLWHNPLGKKPAVTPVMLDMERKQNHTFITYIDTGDDWLDSFESSSSDSSSNTTNSNKQSSNNNINISDNTSSSDDGIGSLIISSEDSSVLVSRMVPQQSLSSSGSGDEKSDDSSPSIPRISATETALNGGFHRTVGGNIGDGVHSDEDSDSTLSSYHSSDDDEGSSVGRKPESVGLTVTNNSNNSVSNSDGTAVYKFTHITEQRLKERKDDNNIIARDTADNGNNDDDDVDDDDDRSSGGSSYASFNDSYYLGGESD